MKKLEEIDKIFSKGLHNYERQPRPEAWEIVEARLQKTERKVLIIWWKYASAASLALLLGVGVYLVNRPKNPQIDVAAKIKKDIIFEKQHLPIFEKPIPGITKVQENIQTNPNLRLNQKIEKAIKYQFTQLHNQQIIKVEEIKQIAKLPTIDFKKIEEQKIIVLVLQNTKPKVEEETIVLNMVETKQEIVAKTDLKDGITKKETRLSKIWQQIKRAKNGDDVDWSKLGIKPQKIFARADAKIENVLTNGESNEK